MKVHYSGLEYWDYSLEELIRQLRTNSYQGLQSDEVNRRLVLYGKNVIKSRRDTNLATLLLAQFKTPIIIMFMFTAFLSMFLGRSEDSIIVMSNNLFVNEATLTGESFPAEKSARILSAKIPIKDRSNSLFMGTVVVSGTAIVLVIYTGIKTELGKISKLEHAKTETEFEKGVKKFGYFLLKLR